MNHYENLIVSGGAAGLYMVWKMASSARSTPVALLEWSPVRLGGQIFTKTFDEGQFLEIGGMRFSNKHNVLQKVLRQLKLTNRIVDFPTTSDCLYYLRGNHIYNSEIPHKGVPYKIARVEGGHFPTLDKLLNQTGESVIDLKK